MSSEPPAGTPGRSIARSDLEQVVRRAVELSLREADAKDKLSEAEVVRIATELGLSPQHVRRAIYELPEIRPPSSILDGFYLPGVFSASRVVPGNAAAVQQRFQDYLTTREYLRIVRQVREKALLQPADDALSKLARGLTRPRSRYYLPRADRVLLHVRPLEEGRSHVQVEVDLSSQRRSSIGGSITLGAILGLGAGAGAAALISLAGVPHWVNTVVDVLAVGGGATTAITASIAAGGRHFRRRVARARTELEGLFDRAERGERLDPPPSPWWRRFELRMGGRRNR